MFRPSVRTPVAAAIAVSGLLALGGCTGSSGGPSTGPTTPAPASSTSTTPSIESPVAAPTRAQASIPAAGSIVEQPALRRVVRLTGCSSATDGWKATGAARNPGDSPTTYRLLVFFTDKYSRVIDYARTSVHVGPGASSAWTAEASFDPPAGTQCVLRGLYAGKKQSG